MSSGIGIGRGGSGTPSIPAASKKMVQSLKEIVNCPEHEIYAMLKECNMDPNDTVNRLLTQDPFHEVKSKREKKKEMKESTESRPRGASSSANRGKGSANRDAGRNTTQFSSSDFGATRGRPAYKKDNGANMTPHSSFSSVYTGNNISRLSTPISDPIPTEDTVQAISTSNNVSLLSKPSSGFQSAWLGGPGHVTMADIVKMGRPHTKASTFPSASTATSHSQHDSMTPNISQQSVKHNPHSTYLPSESYHDVHSSQDLGSKVAENIHEPSAAANQNIYHDDWPLVEQSLASNVPSVNEPTGTSVIYAGSSASSMYGDRVDLHLNSQLDEAHVTERTATSENQTLDSIGSVSTSDRKIQMDNSGGASHFDDGSFNNRSSYQFQKPAYECQEDYQDPSPVEDVNAVVSSAAAGLQHLSLQKDVSASSAEGKPVVIIPDHLQVPTADCSHLSFGSFGSGVSATFVSKTLRNDLGETSPVVDDSSVEHLDASHGRNPEYYGEEQQRSTSTENVESTSSSQPEAGNQNTSVEATHGHQHPFSSSLPDYAFENTTQTNVAGYSYTQTNSPMQNLAPFSGVMQSPINSLPSNLLAPSVQTVRESDYPYSPFNATQSMPTKYSSGMSSISGQTISMPEAMKPSVFTTPQSTPPTLPSTSIPTGPALPQHLPVHPYSQPTLFANMITYPFLPHNYTYVPSAFQQAYAANSVYHQSPAAVQSAGMKYTLPQYKNSVSASSLPQPAAIASGYGGFGSSANIPANFLLNPSTTPPSTTVGYEDVLGSQYKDSNHFVSQQTDASTMWVNGPGSRTMSTLPSSTYFGFQGQNQHGGFRQSQQPSHYGALGYPNFYHSQIGVSQEHHHQAASDGTLSTSQAPPSQQSHQIWQQSY